MRIWLNDQPIILVSGMKVRQALIQADLIQEIEKGSGSLMNGATKSVWMGHWKMKCVMCLNQPSNLQ
jgi:hypothetical protein